ncbi:hypothetical protein CARUB_v10007278mg [Capsella rubella]|uniref:Uncharacterized protein n=1 Tax=Capsella rubella TaxID=81985 RepID=R0F375_9BRAS|nr:hypothetical protein CARUB_v10007278mg [Capsella rubella]
MNRLTFFILVIAIYFGVNEACKLNELVFKNELGVGTRLRYYCRNGDYNSGFRYINHNAKEGIRFKDTGTDKSLWQCYLHHGVNMKLFILIEAYVPITNSPQCGQLREYTARPDAVYFRKDSYPRKALKPWKSLE